MKARTKEEARETLLRSSHTEWLEYMDPTIHSGVSLTELLNYKDERYYLGDDNRLYCYNIDTERWERMIEA